MAKDNNTGFNNNPSWTQEQAANKSFVKRVKSRMSGLFPTSLSKWFTKEAESSKATVRFREDEDEDDDEYHAIQPPTKKVKMPPNNCNSNSTSLTFSVNNINNRVDLERQDFSSPLLNLSPSATDSRNLLNGEDRNSESDDSDSGHTPGKTDGNKSELSTSLLNSSFGNRNRSLFNDRSYSSHINSSLSSRRPSFDASTFGSPSFVDRTLITKRIINSPFYNGRITYGGASAYNSHKRKLSPAKNKIQVKPASQSSVSKNATLSKTARRILDTLEQYTTPISDAKKIPNPLAKRPRHEGLFSQYTGANPYLMREHKTPTAAHKELQIPAVPDLLKMKLRERLQDSTVAMRQIATTSKSLLNTNEYTIKNIEEIPKHTSKMKTKVSSVRQKPQNQFIEEVKLPSVALPITTLPKFDLSLPLTMPSSKPITSVVCDNKVTKTSEVTKESSKVTTASEIKNSNSHNAEYTFSNPLVLAENLVSIIAINDFKFSEPLYKQKTVDNTSNSKFSKPFEVPAINFKCPDLSNITLKKKNPAGTDSTKPAAQLLKVSVNEMFGKKDGLLDKFKPVVGSWECSSCMLRNTADKVKCAACETPKETQTSILDNFKTATAGTWECSTCMIRNTADKLKCVACESPKDKTDSPKTQFNFGVQFKPSLNKWECKECLIRNDDAVNTCVACTAPKSSSLKKTCNGPDLSRFKPPSNTWECSTCMIRNKSDVDKCIACETLRPGAISVSKSSNTLGATPEKKFNFGFIPNATSTTSKTSQDSVAATIATVGTTTSTAPTTIITSTPISSIFGQNTTSITATSTIPTFTFGIPPKESEKKEIKDNQEPIKEIIFKTPEKLPAKTEVSSSSSYVFGKATTPKPIEVTQPITTTRSELGIKSVPSTLPSFGFGSNLNTSQTDTGTATSTTITTSKITPITTTASTSSFKFGANNSLPTKPQLFDTNIKKNASSLPDMPIVFSSLSKPAFANKADSNVLPKAPLSNGNPSKIESLFGSKLPVAVPPSSQPTQTTVAASTTNSFNFTPPQTQQSFLPPVSTSNLFAFGANSTTTSIFGSTTTISTTAPSITTAVTSVFKFGPSSTTEPQFANLNTQPTSNNLFGNSTPNSSTSLFGAANKPSFEMPTNAFGNAASSSFALPKSEIKPFAFGSTTNDSLTQPKVSSTFSFAQVPKPAEAPKAIFNFGNAAATAAPASTTVGTFSFNAPPSVNTSAPSINFNFNPPKLDTTLPFQPLPPTNMFNSPQNTMQPEAQPLQNGFNFGNAAAGASAKAGFNFGVGAAPSVPQFNQPAQPGSSSAIFNFGAPNLNPQAQPAVGFNFNTPAPSFSADIKPTFNFTGGATPTFSAQPGDNSAMAQRRKIKAVRRHR